MATATALSIDVLTDLESTSALRSLLGSNKDVIFGIAEEFAKFSTQPVKEAAAGKATATLTLNAPASWTLPNGIVFSLSASASCAIGIDTLSETFSLATTIDSDNSDNSDDTTDIVAGPLAGVAYVNIDLDFSIQGSAAASGAAGALGIAGTVSGGRSATLSFCQPVDDSLNTLEAIKHAFSKFVFPLDPSQITNMQTGALTRVFFDGTFSAELDVSFGISDHTFAAPSVNGVLASVGKILDITPPSVEFASGITGSVTYNHSDHFGLVVNKTADTRATVILARALASDVGVSAGFTFGVTVTNVQVVVDQDALGALVGKVTGNNALGSQITGAASDEITHLLSGLNAKLANWATGASSQVGLTAGLDRQTTRTTLFDFAADLSDPAITKASWNALLGGDIFHALHNGGLTLQPGSGISESLKRSATIHFQFFNLFAFDQVTDFFKNATVELGPDGTIRLHAAIGDEQTDTVQKSLSTVRIYFVVPATEKSAGSVQVGDVNLRVELIEAKRPGKGATFAQTLTLAANTPTLTSAQDAIATFITAHGASNLTIVYDLHPAAYNRLAFSAFNGKNPSPLPQAADRANWTAFQSAATSLNIAPSSVGDISYDDWVRYNQAATDRPGSQITPDRTHVGNIASGKLALTDNDQRDSVAFFMEASQGLMNLIANLRILADQATAATDIDDYNNLLRSISTVVNDDILVDYVVPIAGALLHQSAAAGTSIAASIDQAHDNSAFTCTVTLS